MDYTLLLCAVFFSNHLVRLFILPKGQITFFVKIVNVYKWATCCITVPGISKIFIYRQCIDL